MIQKLSGKALGWWKLPVAYEADVEAHMDGFEDVGSCHDARRQSMVELGLCDDMMRQGLC